MSDAISSLHADIGFKVSQEGLKEVKNLLTDFAKQLDGLNHATKEAAKQYGIFSKEKSKQALADEKLATQQARTEEVRTRSKIKLRNQAFKEEMAIKKAEADADIKREREKDRVERANARRRERESRENRKFIQNIGRMTGDTLRSALSGAKTMVAAISRVLGVAINESLNRSISTRDFMLATGASLGDIQSVMARFADIGESVPQETIMGDLIKLSQSMASVAMGRDNADAYKLLGTSIRRGDIGGMLRGIGMASRDIDPDMFTNIINSLGLPYYWNSFFRAQGVGGKVNNFITPEGNEQIIAARGSLSNLSLSFKNLADWLTATLSPTIIDISRNFQKWNENMSTYLQEGGAEELSKVLKKLAEDAKMFLEQMTPEKIYTAVKEFFGALHYLTSGIISIARALGFKTNEDKENERLRDLWMSDMVMSGASLTDILKNQHKIPTARGNYSMSDSRQQTMNFYGYGAEEAEEVARNGFDAMNGNSGLYNAAPAYAR